MTATLSRRPTPVVDWPSVHARYRRQGTARAWGRDALQVTGWLAIALPVALWLGQGGLNGLSSAADVWKAAGILSGLVATASMMLMLWLTARVPFIDRTLGQDRATALHASLGQLTFLGLVAHGLFTLTAYALADRLNLFAEFESMWGVRDFALAVAGLLLLTAVSVSSVIAVKKNLPFEAWKAIHLGTYLAVLAGLPHQFTMGDVFVAGPVQWFWIVAWLATFFVLLCFRIFRPFFVSLEQGLVVSDVAWDASDVVSITVTGRRVGELHARAGQYFHWRFLAPGVWWHQHPFSISAAPTGDSLRITVRALGAGTRRLLGVRPGTRVMIEGPYGIFSDAARAAADVVLVGIGIGIAPIRAVLEETDFAPGRGTVVLRASTPTDLYLFDEIEALCRAKGARLYTLTGHRAVDAAGQPRWVPGQYGSLRLGDLCGALASADVYVCGPDAAAELVVVDALDAGTPAAQIHHERFSW